MWPKKARDKGQIDPTLRKLLKALAAGRAKWPLYLYGAPGTGKTCAALCLLDRVRFSTAITTEKLTDIVWDRGDVFWEMLGHYELVLLDELCSRGMDTEREYQAVKRFCDAREGLPTIFISNLSDEAVTASYDDRLHSRICCGTVFELVGEDRRFA